MLYFQKIVIDEKNAWGRMDVYLGKSNLSIYFFQYIEYMDISLSIYHRTYRDISVYPHLICHPYADMGAMK